MIAPQVLKKVAPKKEMTLDYSWRHKVTFIVSLYNYMSILQLYYFAPLLNSLFVDFKQENGEM